MKISEHIKIISWEKNYIKIKVSPRQPKTEFFGILDDWTLKLRLNALPEKWKANKEIIDFLASELWIKKDKIEIISWASDSTKLIRISW